MKNMKEAKITLPKKGTETPLDAKIQIPGYGVMKRNNYKVASKEYLMTQQSMLKRVKWKMLIVFCIKKVY